MKQRKIPESEYILVKDLGHVITDALLKKYHTKKELNSFYGFMTGQTCSCLEDGKTTAIYICDYERWLKTGKPSENDMYD